MAMACRQSVACLWICTVLLYVTTLFLAVAQDTRNCRNVACYPPFLDLFQDLPNRTVTVTSTCGDPPNDYELRFIGSGGGTYQQRLCNASDPETARPSSALYDSVTSFHLSRPDLTTWWQSVNGAQDVKMMLTLGDQFLFQETRLAFRSPRPRSLYVEKSTNYGISWSPLKYYAVSCSQMFPSVSTGNPQPSYLPTCEERYVFDDTSTEIPNSNIQEVRYNPAHVLGAGFSQEAVMRYFTVTNIRVTLGRPGVDTNLRNYFAVADWEVKGQCLCFGHAEECQGEDGSECVCQHNTAGRHCDRCLPMFNNRPWQAAVLGPNGANACEDCGCNGYATSCMYNATKGYGICQGCFENTGGDKCERCNDNYFRNPYTDPSNNDTCVDVTAPFPCSQYCWPCMCNINGTEPSSICNEMDGSCECKLNVQNLLCDECKDTFYNLSSSNPFGCQTCDCNPVGSLGSTNFCDKQTGQCICKTNVEGNRCDTCKVGTYNLDAGNPEGCSLCSCDLGASLSGQCNSATGACTCRPNITGRACNRTQPGFYVPRLDGLTFEAEVASAEKNVSVEERPTDTNAARHSGRGFLKVPAATTLAFTDAIVPRTQAYEVVLRYESEATFQGVRIQLEQQQSRPYDCQGVSLPGTVMDLVSNILAAGVGGAERFGSVCLDSASVYNISVVVGTSDFGESVSLLVDSMVLLPVLDDLDVFTSDRTSNATRADMIACWEQAVSAGTDRIGDCNQYEFSIMAEVYNGAIACSCNDEGTVPGSVCNSHSGQCLCVEGVTSRSCDYCKAYHFGYNTMAGCRPCECNTDGAVKQACDEKTGVCDCHTNVIGAKCAACRPRHYGLNTATGCVPCTCNMRYASDNECDDSGQCSCKPGIGGQNCTECSPGFFELTVNGCTSCDCNSVGSTQNGCDSAGNCLCREGTTGDKCENCAEGFYGFGPWSERGCFHCFCSSHSAECTSATSWFVAQVRSRWSLLDFGAVAPRWTGITGSGNALVIDVMPILDISDPRLVLELIEPTNSTDVFFVSPSIFHGDFRTAYGQSLAFSLSQSTDLEPSVSPEGDVFIEGMYVDEAVVASLPRPPNTNLNETEYQFKLHENYWRKGSLQGDQLTSQYMIQLLAGIRSIRIRAKFNTLPGESTFLHSVRMSYATEDRETVTGTAVDFVENCTCPAEYTGLFCETCSPGYKRLSLDMGPFADCVPCDCNGHSDLTCDPVTGVCQGCRDNTGGNFCEICLDGYYGNATSGTPGDCQPCMCPGPPGSINSFSSVCDDSGACTACTVGHIGDYCQECIPGYFGVPTDSLTNNGQCLPCSCNLSPADCDTTTGMCLNCTGNTAGHTCNVCAFGYWGTIDNCQECVCNATGGYGNCSRETGTCSCYPNVIGDRCTQCDVDTWGFASGSGCEPCDCHPVGTADQLTQCDVVTGQCVCKPRVTGQKCDQCVQGFWDVNRECIPCECNPDGTDLSTCDELGNCVCEVTTGQCSCKSVTIAGLTCNRCGRLDEDGTEIVTEVFVGTFPNCEPCPECFQNWRKAFQDMADIFSSQQTILTGLLANYGDLTTAEVESMLDFIRRNLSSAIAASEAGTREVVDLEDIQAGYRQISSQVANYTDLVSAVMVQQAALRSVLMSNRQFNGSIVLQEGIVKNIQDIQQELDALDNAQRALFRQANDSWVNIQAMYAAIESSEQHIQQLIQSVDELLQNIERAATDRQTATQIINSNFRDAEYAQNTARLIEIDAIQQTYPLASTAQNASVVRQLVEQVNMTAQESLQSFMAVQSQAATLAYRTEVVRFNATSADTAAGQAQSAALSYKDLALSTQSDMTNIYVQAVEAYTALQDAETRSAEAQTIAQLLQGTSVQPVSQMQELVSLITTMPLNNTAVQTLLADAGSKLGRAEQAKISAIEAQQEAESVNALLQTIEYELAEAQRVREDTVQRLAETDGNITSIDQTTSQVQQQADLAVTRGQQTSASISAVLQGVRTTDQCFRVRRNQALDATHRAGLAKTQAETANQVSDLVSQNTAALGSLIDASVERSSRDLDMIQTLSDDAGGLQQDLVSLQQMADLDALMNQYIAQRAEMQELSTTLEGLEASLDAVLTNLDRAQDDDLQCN